MEYQGPTAGDLANIRALNRCFLEAIIGPRPECEDTLGADPLTETQVARLASAPFLLFSFRERDDDYWERALSDDAQLDLVDSVVSPDEQVREFQAAALAFLWQLVRRNPYAARLVCGATVSWCERLAEQTLIALLQKVATRRDLTRVRFHTRKGIWRRMLASSKSASHQARLASQHCALQAMLTRRNAERYERLPAAACNMAAAGIRTRKV